MDTGKVPFGSEIYLVIKNPLYSGKCPCCGHKSSKKVPKFLVVEATYSSMDIGDGDNVDYYADYYDEIRHKGERVWINRWYLDDIIDSPWHSKGEDYKPDDFDVYSKDIDICEYRGEFDGVMAFHTKEEAEQYIEEFGEYL